MIRNDTVTAFVGDGWAALHIQVLTAAQKTTGLSNHVKYSVREII